LSGIETLHPGGLALTKRTGEVAGIRPGLSVLDVSSGRGTQALFYARTFGVSVTGIDIAEEMVRVARTRASREGLSDRVRFELVDLAQVLESAFLRALAEPSRLEILKVLLVHGPADVGTIASYLPNERSVVSRHLKVLLDARIVNVHKESRRRVYAVDGQAILHRFEVILAQVRSVASICCPLR